MIEQEIGHVLTFPGKLLAELEVLMTNPKHYSSQVSQLRDYARYLDTQISDAALELSARELSGHDAAHLAGLVRISRLGQVLADQTGELVELVHQIQERGITLSEASRTAIQHSLVPCGMNLTTLTRDFPDISDAANERMRKQDDLLRETVTYQYREYLQRFASGKTPSGTEFSRILFQIEGMAATIREIRKSTRLLRQQDGSME
jgi:Na+/phosphate symporter